MENLRSIIEHLYAIDTLLVRTVFGNILKFEYIVTNEDEFQLAFVDVRTHEDYRLNNNGSMVIWSNNSIIKSMRVYGESDILNLTQEPATIEQIMAGVSDPLNMDEISELLTFDEEPSIDELVERSKKLVKITEFYGCERAMIDNASYRIFDLRAKLLREEEKLQIIII